MMMMMMMMMMPTTLQLPNRVLVVVLLVVLLAGRRSPDGLVFALVPASEKAAAVSTQTIRSFFNPPSSSSTTCTTTRLFQTNNDNDNNNNDNDGRIDKGFNLLELASQFVPQGRIVQTAKGGWNLLWGRFMAELAPQDRRGNYRRPTYTFKGTTLGSIQHPLEPNRYSVYLGNPCPWCHRVKLVIELLGLSAERINDDSVLLLDVTTLVDDPVRASRGGWVFPGPDHNHNKLGPQHSSNGNNIEIQDLRELYDLLQPGYQGRCTAPLLVDWTTRSIVSNESKDIVRMLPLLLDCVEGNSDQSKNKEKKRTTYTVDLYPTELRTTIEERNEWIYRLLNNGVYRCGFGTTQRAVDAASADVLEGLERCEQILSTQKFMCSNTLVTESDVMLLPTMLRFDGVYAPLFRAGGTQIRLECDYPAIFRWMKRCWQDVPGVPASIDLSDACSSYYKQLFPLNPGGILPTPITAQTLHLEN